jgi:hypothetical protein
MVQTRAQGKRDTDIPKGASKDEDTKTPATVTPKKRTHSKTEAANTSKKVGSTKKARKDVDHHHADKQPTSEERGKPNTTESTSDAPTYPKIDSLIEKYGAIPLSDTALEEPQSPKPETILALLLNALFSSTRISHELAAKTIATAIKADYHKIDTLRKSTWDERTQVLTEGGYTRYREKTATGLGELVELIDSKYGECHQPLKKPT